MIITVSDEAEPELEAVVGGGLDAFNDALVGYADRKPLHVLVRDTDSGGILGGMCGRTSLGLLFIELVFLPESLRGQALGSQMLALAEEEARRRGCKAGVLYTINFQAPGFYQNQGWEIFGEIPCDPPGTSRVFLKKNFDTSSS